MRVMNEGGVYFFFQAEDGIRDLVRSRGLGDVYKRQTLITETRDLNGNATGDEFVEQATWHEWKNSIYNGCLLYTSDAADERSSVDLGGRRIIQKKNLLDVPLQSCDQRTSHTDTHVIILNATHI